MLHAVAYRWYMVIFLDRLLRPAETVLERRRLDRLHRAQALAVSASDLVRAQYHAQKPGGAAADAPVTPFTMLMQTKVQLHDALHTWMRSGSTGMVGMAIGCTPPSTSAHGLMGLPRACLWALLRGDT